MRFVETDIVRWALEAAVDRKALEPVVLDVQGISTVADAFLVAGGTSDTHVRAIADAIREAMKARGIEPMGAEGYNVGEWVLLDYFDLVVHVFHRDKRVYYDLENLWSDAPRIKPDDPTGAGRRGSSGARSKDE